jgi:hypothetical protein
MFTNRTAVIATMHQKERVIAPILQAALGLEVVVPEQFDTDAFGTFMRDVPRPGDQLATARLKAQKALEVTGATLAIASEGSFAPHPALPMLPSNRELVLLLDLEQGLEIVGSAVSTETNFAHQTVRDWPSAAAFGQKVGFPEHGVIVMSAAGDRVIAKGMTNPAQFQATVEQALQQSPTGSIHVETDMRALYNPSRMAVIAAATTDLVKQINRRCPHCQAPGFALVARQPGLPCRLCNYPTLLTRAHIYACQKCHHRQEVLFPDGEFTADPAQCEYCNP